MNSFLLLIIVASGTANSCRFPPSLWCDSAEIALQCKVFDQCMQSVWREDVHAPPVSLELYFESLCPDCRQFITTQLYPTYSKIGAIMNLTLVPYGNAREKKVGDRWVFECQHGKEECIGNLLETCAIHTVGDMGKIMPFIYCVEKTESQSPMSAVKSCAGKQRIPLEPILACYNSTEGNRLEHQMALRTDALTPRHEYVPWLVLNGIHTEKINDKATTNLLKLICDTYTGPKPSACSRPERRRSSLRSRISEKGRQPVSLTVL